jgi:glutaminyl-peptide cyclotransferase
MHRRAKPRPGRPGRFEPTWVLALALALALSSGGCSSSHSGSGDAHAGDVADTLVFPDTPGGDGDPGDTLDAADTRDVTDLAPPTPQQYTVEVVERYPHDPQAFTQGLLVAGGVLYESTGLYGSSSIREVDLATGEVVRRHDLSAQYFGEGIAVVDDRLVQLTWQEHVGFVYALDTFELVDDFSYATEGWGLTYDGARLILSDGSATLTFLDPETYARLGEVRVVGPDGPVTRLNELEMIDGQVFANVWLTDTILVIDPGTGHVQAEVDCSGLLGPGERPADPNAVLNGIAWDAEAERLFVTGKLWPTLFEIRLVPR